jgi:hypothetical protein
MIGGTIYSALLGIGIYGIMFAIPIFVQDYLHYTALQSGLLLVPGALVSAATKMLFKRISEFRPAFVDRLQALSGHFAAQGADPAAAHDQAMKLIDRVVSGQAMLVSFSDLFMGVGTLFIVSLPIILLLGGKKAGANAKDAAASAH